MAPKCFFQHIYAFKPLLEKLHRKFDIVNAAFFICVIEIGEPTTYPGHC